MHDIKIMSGLPGKNLIVKVKIVSYQFRTIKSFHPDKSAKIVARTSVPRVLQYLLWRRRCHLACTCLYDFNSDVDAEGLGQGLGNMIRMLGIRIDDPMNASEAV